MKKMAQIHRRRHIHQHADISDENLKIMVQKTVAMFMNSMDEYMEFPSSFSKETRTYIHEYVKHLGLLSHSHGKGAQRTLMLHKRVNKCTTTQWIALQPETRRFLTRMFMEGIPKMEVTPQKSRRDERLPNGLFMLPKLSKKQIPLKGSGPKDISEDRLSLPIAQYRNTILKTMETNRVIIISGDTGSGKTTQVPQYFLEKSFEDNVPCRIICTQPRRMAAVTIAQRVAKERGERLGGTVGYQIRLENCLSKETNLIYTTSGCVLRSLMANVGDIFRGLSHIIIDEVHDRDKNTDFILISIRDQLKLNENLKVILMSATMDINLLSVYFGGIPIINVPGRCYETNILHLEEILYFTEYKTPKMTEILHQMELAEAFEIEKKQDILNSYVDDETQKFIDEVMDHCLENNGESEENFLQLEYMICGEGLPPNVRHSKNRKTALILAAQMNQYDFICKFLQLGTNKSYADSENLTALDYAALFMDKKCFNYLYSYDTNNGNIAYDSEKILTAYRAQFNDDGEIDHNLLLTIVTTLHKSTHPGSILIFLPGYNDIMMQNDMINEYLPPFTFKLFLLHSNMNMQDQQAVLDCCPVRKIILSTNIGETSITFPDVAFVIDSGKVKMNAYDSITGSSYLTSVWISQACALQRAGRAGRTQEGFCYRMYSQKKFDSMEKYAIPEFLRIPLTEICLYARVISKNSSITSYLSDALQPPSAVSVYMAVNKLKIIGALDENENITDLGRHLVDMPLEVQLGKIVLYSIILKCIDPVLTIVAFHSIKDPFILPADRNERLKASFRRKLFAGDSCSDHVGIVNMYRQWRESKRSGQERKFCSNNYLTKTTLDMMHAARQQISDHIKRKYQNLGNLNEYNRNSDNWNMVSACLVAGLYPNVINVDRVRGKLLSRLETTIAFHPSSALRPTGCKETRQCVNQLNNDWIVFFEKTRCGCNANIRYNTTVPPIILALFGGPAQLNDNDYIIDQTGKLIIDDWIDFFLSDDDQVFIYKIRQFFKDVLNDFLTRGKIKDKRFCDSVIFAIDTVLRLELGAQVIYEKDNKNDVMSDIGHFQHLKL